MVKVKGDHNHPINIKRKSTPRTRRARPDEQNIPMTSTQKQFQVQRHQRQQQQPVIVSVSEQAGEYYEEGIEYMISEDLSL